MSAPVKLALQRKEAAAALSLSVDSFDRHVRAQLRCVYVGDVRLWPVAEIERWLAEHAIIPGTTTSAPAPLATAGGMAQGDVTP